MSHRRTRDTATGLGERIAFLRSRGPKGLFMIFALDRISRKPSHGYEIMQAIDNLTEGALKPGPGTVYPMLKRLVRQGYLDAERGTIPTQRVYHITPEGITFLQGAKKALAGAARRFSPLSRVFFEIADPEELGRVFAEGGDRQFRLTREMIQSKLSQLPLAEQGFLLREYALQLERELNWVTSYLEGLRRSAERDDQGRVAVKA